MRSWGAFHPVEHEQRAFDAPDLAEREIQAVLLAVGAELAQHRRGLYGHGFDTGRQPQGVVPVLEHDLLVDRLAHEGGELLPPPGSAEARQPTIRKVAQPRSKRKVEQVEQGEDVVGDAAGIDMVPEGVEWGGVRSHVSRDRPMPGSCSSSASSAFFRLSPRASLSACADSLRARARPARPMRSNMSALGNTNRYAFISPLKL